MNQLSGYDVFEVAGEKLPFKYGVNAFALFCKHRGIELGQLPETGLYGVFQGTEMLRAPDMIANIELAYFAYVTAVRMKGEEPGYNLCQFTEMIGETRDIIQKLQELLLTCRTMGYTFEEIAQRGATESKKK
jgi:hypothetical protein